jgi:hypothetical protein
VIVSFLTKEIQKETNILVQKEEITKDIQEVGVQKEIQKEDFLVGVLKESIQEVEVRRENIKDIQKVLSERMNS